MSEIDDLLTEFWHIAYEHGRDDVGVDAMSADRVKITIAIRAYLDALPPPEGDVGELVERLRQTEGHMRAELSKHAWSINDVELYADGCDLLRKAAEALSRQLPAPTGNARPLTSGWLGYWAGAGSVDSVTRITRSEYDAKRWRLDGAEVTELIERPLYAAPVVASAKAGEQSEALTRLKFFRDLSPAERMKVYAVFGIPDDALAEVSSHAVEHLLFKRLFAAAPQSPMGEGTVGVWGAGTMIEALDAAAYYVDRLRTVHSGKPVRDLEEAGAAYYRLSGEARAALSPSPQGTGK